MLKRILALVLCGSLLALCGCTGKTVTLTGTVAGVEWDGSDRPAGFSMTVSGDLADTELNVSGETEIEWDADLYGGWSSFCGGVEVTVEAEPLPDGGYAAKKVFVTGLEPTDAKPVLYLYPAEETAVSVRLDYDGVLTCAYPAYDGGWQVTASPDGTLFDGDTQYNYLYWEGRRDADYDFSEGFCVRGEDTAAFLEDALAKLGLTRREANEFIVYWLPLMQDNAYNISSFQGAAYTDHARLTITPQPDTLLRVFMAWKASDEPVSLPPQELTAPARAGFTAVDWGGAEN